MRDVNPPGNDLAKRTEPPRKEARRQSSPRPLSPVGGIDPLAEAQLGKLVAVGESRSRDVKPMTNAVAADEALHLLIEGNARFQRGETRFMGRRPEVLARLAKGQQPFATILGCSDSRVPPELIFDAVLGELFVIRVAGNVVSSEIAGSLQYAGEHLRTPLFLVLGHSGCGAVHAALAYRFRGVRHRSRIQVLVDSILPGLREIDPDAPADAQLSSAVEANVRWTKRQLLATEAGARVTAGEFKLVGGVYDMMTGAVRLLEAT